MSVIMLHYVHDNYGAMQPRGLCISFRMKYNQDYLILRLKTYATFSLYVKLENASCITKIILINYYEAGLRHVKLS
jgi:hypothetical protein